MIITNWIPPSMESMAWGLELYEDEIKCAEGRIEYVRAGLARLSDVDVYPQFRGRGIGEMLFKILVYKCGQLEIESVLTDKNNESQSFYESLGFREFDNNNLIKEIPNGGCENCANKSACEKGQG